VSLSTVQRVKKTIWYLPKSNQQYHLIQLLWHYKT
jgi:hypothetical protein